MTTPESPPRRPWRRRLVAAAAAVIAVLALAVVGERVLDLVAPFPRAALTRPTGSLILVDADGSELRWQDRGGIRQHWVGLSAISPHFLAALIASEDRRFRGHGGVDGLALARATAMNLMHGRRTSGASTLTMQTVRLCLPGSRTWTGKIQEALRARQLERLLDKDTILEQYCNRVPFGGRLVGVEAASRSWFGKRAADLGPAEAAMLVAMLPAPSRRSPVGDRDLLRRHRDRILGLILTVSEVEDARAEALPTAPHPFPWLAPHACDHALARSGSAEGTLILDLRLADQRRLEQAIAGEGPVDGLAAVVCDREGRIRAHLGSTDWHLRPFDAASAGRSVGSTLKPFLYRRALADDILGSHSLVADRPVEQVPWSPRNEDERYLGDLPLDEALVRSRNPPAVRTLAAIGLDAFADELHHHGLDLAVNDLGAALGTATASPIDLARAYATLSRGANHDPRARQILTALGRIPLHPLLSGVAWKTGTSDDRRDAWCVAVDGDRVIVVWVGWLDGRADPRLRGRGPALRLCAQAVAALRG